MKSVKGNDNLFEQMVLGANQWAKSSYQILPVPAMQMRLRAQHSILGMRRQGSIPFPLQMSSYPGFFGKAYEQSNFYLVYMPKPTIAPLLPSLKAFAVYLHSNSA